MKYFIITGASRGLGESLAKRIVDTGNCLFCISRQANADLKKREEHAPGRLHYFTFDLSNTEGIPGLVDTIFEKIEADAEEVCLINNAGVLAPIKPIGEAEAKDIRANIETNLLAPIILISEFLKHTGGMKAVKKIVNLSSKASRSPRMNWLCYGSSKSGIDNVTRSVSLEQQSLTNGASIISFYPGVMDTAMRKENQRAKPIGTRIAGLLKSAFSAQPKVYDPDVVAEGLVRHLSSDSFGSKLYVDFEDITLARKPGRMHGRRVDALHRLARAAIVGTAGVFRRSVAGRGGDRVLPSPARPPARPAQPAVGPRRKVLAMPSRTSRLLIRQINPDWCSPSGPSCSSQFLMSPFEHGHTRF